MKSFLDFLNGTYGTQSMNEWWDSKHRAYYKYDNYKDNIPELRKIIGKKKVIINIDPYSEFVHDAVKGRSEFYQLTSDSMKSFYGEYSRVLTKTKGITFDDVIKYVEDNGIKLTDLRAARNEISKQFGLPIAIVQDLLVWRTFYSDQKVVFDMSQAAFAIDFDLDSTNNQHVGEFMRALETFFTKFIGYYKNDLVFTAYNNTVDVHDIG